MEKIDISIIIPTLNRGNIIEGLLDSILSQTAEDIFFEVIVVDNGSLDETESICANYGLRFSYFKYVKVSTPGLHACRHAGLKIALGRILTFLDDDIILNDNFICSVIDAFNKDDSIALVGGKILPKWSDNPPFWLWQLWNDIDKSGQRILPHLSLVDSGDKIKDIDATLIFGCNFSIRNEILIETKGFHPDGMPQDLIMFRGDGETYVSKFIEAHQYYKALYHPGVSVFHRIPRERMTFDYFAKRSFNQGISNSYSELRDNQFEVSQNYAFRLAKSAKNKIKSLFGYKAEKILLEIQDNQRALPINNIINRYTRAGYNFHQKYYRFNEEIREWVHRDNYLQ